MLSAHAQNWCVGKGRQQTPGSTRAGCICGARGVCALESSSIITYILYMSPVSYFFLDMCMDSIMESCVIGILFFLSLGEEAVNW